MLGLGLALGRTDFSWIAIFELPDLFPEFAAGCFLLFLVGASAIEIPSKIPEIFYKNPWHMFADWQAPKDDAWNDGMFVFRGRQKPQAPLLLQKVQ